MDEAIGKANTDESVMMDSTQVFSKSELLTVNAKRYNSDFDFDKQIDVFVFHGDATTGVLPVD